VGGGQRNLATLGLGVSNLISTKLCFVCTQTLICRRQCWEAFPSFRGGLANIPLPCHMHLISHVQTDFLSSPAQCNDLLLLPQPVLTEPLAAGERL
jgi:hypothetical protein